MQIIMQFVYNKFSAGVGRTGAFIAIYVQLARAEREESIDIYNYVQYMRKQRPSMVLNEVGIGIKSINRG